MVKKYNIGDGKKISVLYNDVGIAQITKEAIEQMLVPTLQKAEKYKWHDLRKNPEDLPKEDGEVAYIVKDGRKFYTTGETLKLYFALCPTEKWGIIAWKYEEPLESEKDIFNNFGYANKQEYLRERAECVDNVLFGNEVDE